ncbi:MAG: hypothetical protein R8M45_01120, partial [Ghiorsea sp.]
IICDSFAPTIHQRPELWLWIHRRWLYLDEKEEQAKKELAANLSDLCKLHEVNYERATQLEYPNGSISMLNPRSHGIGGAVYLSESAYSVFMAWVGDCHE